MVRNEETYRHGRTGQHLALGVTEELEAETFLQIKERNIYLYQGGRAERGNTVILPNRK